jgi:hypothetical protein
MSSLTILGDTSGSVVLAAPAVAGSNTVTLPTTGGTVITTTSSGTILQVVGATYATESPTTSTSYVATGLTASITPKFSTSKIYVVATYGCYTTDNGKYSIFRNTTNVVPLGLGQLRSNASDSTMTLTYLDSPATTSATSYTVYMRCNSTGTTYIALNNWTCQITLMEIAA